MSAALVFSTSLGLATPSALAVTLKQELQHLLDKHPQLKAGRDNVAAAGEGVNFADSLFLPTINVTGDSGYKRIDNPARRATGDDWGRGFEKLTMTVTQNLFDGSRKNRDKDVAELNHEAVRGTVEETRQSLLFQGTNTYIDIIRQMALVRLGGKSESTIAYQLDLEDERVKRGGGTAVDVLLSKTRLQRSKEQRVVFEGNLRDAVTRYTLLFGHPPDLENMEDPRLEYELVPKDIDVAVSAALAANPLITNSNRQIDIARLRQRSLQSDYLPRLDVVGSANYEDDREGTLGNRRDYSVTLQATWNLFSGFSTRSSVAEAAHTYSASINNHLFVNRRIEEEARLAWQSVLTACDRRMLLANAVSIASEVHASRVKLREVGQETAINALDAEGEVFNAEINEVAAQYDEKLSIYRLATAMGLNLADVLEGEYTPEVSAQSKELYTQRCEDRLKTVALRSPAASSNGAADNPFAAPADTNSDEEAANPFAAPVADEGDEEASNPFAVPAKDDSDEDNGSPLAARPEDNIETEDETEASTANPFADSAEEGQDETDDDDGLSLKKAGTVPKIKTLEDELEEDDGSLRKPGPTSADEGENDAIRELESELNKSLDNDDKLSSLMLPKLEEEAETEWDDGLKSEIQ